MSDRADDAPTSSRSDLIHDRAISARGPAIALIVAGVCALAIDLCSFAFATDLQLATSQPIAVIAMVLAFRVPMIAGGAWLYRTRCYWCCVLGGAAALLPTNASMLFTVPVGIWVLVTLSRREVRAGFVGRCDRHQLNE